MHGINNRPARITIGSTQTKNNQFGKLRFGIISFIYHSIRAKENQAI